LTLVSTHAVQCRTEAKILEPCQQRIPYLVLSAAGLVGASKFSTRRRPAHSLRPLLRCTRMVLLRAMAFLDLFARAVFGLAFQFLRLLATPSFVTHVPTSFSQFDPFVYPVIRYLPKGVYCFPGRSSPSASLRHLLSIALLTR
jgi:hypothetical protein